MEYQISQGGLSVVIDSQGAELQSVCLDGHEYLWQGDPSYWPDRSPLLFPFVGRFTRGAYTLHGREYHLPIHGFARDSRFEVTEAKDDTITFCLSDGPDTQAVYPGRFLLTVTYRICENTLHVSYDVMNRGEQILYFGIGGHPGFAVPMEDGLTFDDYYLEFSCEHCPDRVGHTEHCFLSGSDTPFPLENGRVLRLRHDMFDEDAIVLKNAADTVTLRSDRGTRSVTMHYPLLPYLGLWHAPRTDAPYICIEPWTSLPSRQDIVEEFTCKSDLIRLPAGASYCAGWQMSLT